MVNSGYSLRKALPPPTIWLDAGGGLWLSARAATPDLKAAGAIRHTGVTAWPDSSAVLSIAINDDKPAAMADPEQTTHNKIEKAIRLTGVKALAPGDNRGQLTDAGLAVFIVTIITP